MSDNGIHITYPDSNVEAIVNRAKAEAETQHQRFLMEMEAGSRSASQLPLDVQMRMSHPEHFGVQGGLPLDVRQRIRR